MPGGFCNYHMKASLKIECIGNGYDQTHKLFKSILTEATNAEIAECTFGTFKASYFVAEITGLHPKYGYERRFLKPQRDYRSASSTGNRGVYAYYILESGKIYDVLKPVSWKNSHRYFCTVDEDGDIITLEKKEVDECLKNR